MAGWALGLAGWPRGECMDGWMVGWTDEQKISPFYRSSSSIGAAAQKLTLFVMQCIPWLSGAHNNSVSNSSPSTYVCVHHLPTLPSLQNMCRTIILQHVPPNRVSLLPLPNKILDFLSYKPEFDYKHH